MDAQLFLAHADDHEPMLKDGIPVDTTLDAPLPEQARLEVKRSARLGVEPDDLQGQQWAIVAPKGPVGDRLLELVAPLRHKRESEQNREAHVFRVDPGMNGWAASNWMQGEYRDVFQRQESARPRYLMVLGNPDVISWELQQMLAADGFVGRVAFDQDADYESYVDKVLRFSEKDEMPRATALFHTVLDGSSATQEGHRHLSRPLLELVQACRNAGTFDIDDLLDIPMDSSGSTLDPVTAVSTLLRQAEKTRAAMLFTLSHGAGAPKPGWKSPDEQRAYQGAVVLGRKGDLLTANDIAHNAFLPGGVWFMFACYGAGTPARSAYMPWLEKLHHLGVLRQVPSEVLGSLPGEGQPPFVAALPRMALANPNGPLGVVGHVDLAWSWSFLDYEVVRRNLVAKSRMERFQGIVQGFVDGHRFGVAHHELASFFQSVGTQLTAMYEERAQKARGLPEFAEDLPTQVRRANLWMQRQDLQAYVLLGDPAARLPITRRPRGIPLSAPARVQTLDPDLADLRYDVVLAILRGTDTPEAMARRHGHSQAEIERWVDIFVEAGRAALGQTP
ncbi:MAG TPA: helix-turn-helix domain-containing protein [Polyangium sp.]|nr:helix-turn-helix domain-containing protein [Polyangium sp.]